MERPSLVLVLRGRTFTVSPRVWIVGVLNVTPDSFSDGGRYFDAAAAVDHALIMAEQGADMIDIGAESTRPGAEPVEEAEEWRRLEPVLRTVGARLSIPISVDTRKAGVARRALDLGAAIVNDVSALRDDAALAEIVARERAGVVLMHMRGTPLTMQDDPRYDHVVADVKRFLNERMAWAVRQGILPEQIILDPGIGFGKHVEHNLQLLGGLEAFQDLGRPLLVGVSRKAFLGRILGHGSTDRMMGTAGAVATAVLKGAHMVRVHDVAEMRDVVRVVERVRQSAGDGTNERNPRKG